MRPPADLLELLAEGPDMPEESVRAALEDPEGAKAAVGAALAGGEDLLWGACFMAGMLSDSWFLDPLLHLLDAQARNDPALRHVVLAALARLGTPAVEPLLERMLDREADEIRRLAIAEALLELTAAHPECGADVARGWIAVVDSETASPLERAAAMACLDDLDWKEAIPTC
ncbi:MAG: HEAT repeat domain-containing protein [Armatimonadetes bacterium]|nr:HEAT repeat domain-containing protein [Armatimonadota bacterium]